MIVKVEGSVKFDQQYAVYAEDMLSRMEFSVAMHKDGRTAEFEGVGELLGITEDLKGLEGSLVFHSLTFNIKSVND